jgi:hypothetical protein
MKNSEILMYMGAIICTFIGMIVHINLMIETDKFIHFLCFLLYMIMSLCFVTIFKHKMVK